MSLQSRNTAVLYELEKGLLVLMTMSAEITASFVVFSTLVRRNYLNERRSFFVIRVTS